jgi:hypothetical protein
MNYDNECVKFTSVAKTIQIQTFLFNIIDLIKMPDKFEKDIIGYTVDDSVEEFFRDIFILFRLKKWIRILKEKCEFKDDCYSFTINEEVVVVNFEEDKKSTLNFKKNGSSEDRRALQLCDVNNLVARLLCKIPVIYQNDIKGVMWNNSSIYIECKSSRSMLLIQNHLKHKFKCEITNAELEIKEVLLEKKEMAAQTDVPEPNAFIKRNVLVDILDIGSFYNNGILANMSNEAWKIGIFRHTTTTTTTTSFARVSTPDLMDTIDALSIESDNEEL